jgi:hypothetical protein
VESVAEPEAEPTPTERTYTAAEHRAVQNEAKNLRARYRELEATVAGHAPALEAVQTELAAARAELAALVDEARGYRLRSAIADAARNDDTLRGVDAELAARLIDGVEWGDDGKPKGVTAALKRVVERFPQVAAAPTPRTPQPPAGSGIGAQRTITTEDVILQKRQSDGYSPF